MRRFTLRTLMAIALVVVILGGLSAVFFMAEGNVPTVTFDFDQKEFVFENVLRQEGNIYPDLFADFKEMMPGDSRSQTIRVKVENLEDGYIYLYLRTEPVWQDNPAEITSAEAEGWKALTDQALSQMNLVIRQDEQELTKAALAEGVFLGKFRRDGALDLDVTLEIPIEVGNELQSLRGEIGWVFTAEYYKDPDVSTDPDNPNNPNNPDNPDNPDAPNRPGLDKGGHYAYIIGYPDGLVHPEYQITRAESTTIFFRMLLEESRQYYWSQVNPYPDVAPYQWFNNAISTMTNAGIVEGYPDGSFRPDGNITRAEFAAMAVRFFTGEDAEVSDNVFPDVQDHWANYEINLAYAHDLIQGYPDGTFKPDQEITRAEAITIVNRVLERYPHKDHLLEDMIRWPDNMDESIWYYADVQEATNSHVFDMHRDEKPLPHEHWTSLLPVRDWAALERSWSEYNSSHNPGEIVSSKDTAIFKN